MIELNSVLKIKALDILKTYNGDNEYILSIMKKREGKSYLPITENQANYIVNNHTFQVKEINKFLDLTNFFRNSLMRQYNITVQIDKILIEKIIAEQDKAYHAQVKLLKNRPSELIWIPKSQLNEDLFRVIPEVNVDWEKYSSRPPMKHQKEAINKLLQNDKFLLLDTPGLGKGLEKNTNVITPNGKKKICDLVINDDIIGSDGKTYQVKGIFPQGIKDLYEIQFSDGYSVTVDEEHLWSVSTKDMKNDVVLSTKQLISDSYVEHKGVGRNSEKTYKFNTYYLDKTGKSKWKIPIVKPINFNTGNDLPIDPYLLGLCLGDGHIMTKYVRFTIHKDDFDEMFEGIDIKNVYTNDKRPNVKNCKIKFDNELIGLGLCNKKSHEKFIPNIYKYSSIDERLKLLQGLMDTDGHCMNNKTGNFLGTEFSTTSKQLADDVVELVQSLGGIARLKQRFGYYIKNGVKKHTRVNYRINIKMDGNINPFKLSRKKILYNEPKKYKVKRYIRKIEKKGTGETICISVNSPDKLFVIEHSIVTHNTASSIIAALESKVKKILIICPASLKHNWKKEISIYDDLNNVSIIQREWTPNKWTIINYDILDKFNTIEKPKKSKKTKFKFQEYDNKIENNHIINEKFDLIICDEAHYLKASKSNRTKHVKKIIKNIGKRWFLTGTPITNKPIDLFSLLSMVDHPLSTNYNSFLFSYCNGRMMKINGRKIIKADGASNLEELNRRIKPVSIRRRKEDVLDLPDKIISPIYIGLDDDERIDYNSSVERYIQLKEEQGKNMSYAKKLVELSVLRRWVAENKLKHTKELINTSLETDKKVIVFTDYTSVVNTLKEEYNDICVVINGETPQKERQKIVESFQNDSNVKLFIGNTVAAGVGLTLTQAEVVIVNDLNWTPANVDQSLDRAYRIGQTKNVVCYFPLFDDTIDTIVYDVLDKKRNIINMAVDGVIDNKGVIEEVISKLDEKYQK